MIDRQTHRQSLVKALSSGPGLWDEKGNKINVGARDERQLQENSVFCTQQDSYIFKITETMTTFTKHTQVQIRQIPSTEKVK